jgi:hypothetical protein
MSYDGLERYITERAFGCRVSDKYTYRGWTLIVLENELLRISILPEKGSDIWEFAYKPLDLNFLSRTPQGLVDRQLQIHSTFSLTHNFMDFYEGAWQEVLPSGGAGCAYKGAEYGLHGELWNDVFEWAIERDEPEEVSLRLTCRLKKVPLVLEKRLTLRSGEPVLHIDEKITNDSPEAVDYMWGHPPAFGPPFLSRDCVVDVPAGKIAVHSFPDDPDKRFAHGGEFKWPEMTSVSGRPVDGSLIPGPESRGSDELCLLDLREGWYALTNRKIEVGFALEWDLEMFPYVWFWQMFGGGSVYPWFGRMFSCAIEPWSSYPLFGLEKCIANGTAKKLGPHETVSTSLKAIAYTGAQRVAGVQDGRVTPA